MDNDGGSLSSPSGDVVGLIRLILVKEHKWNFVGPRLRCLSRHWREAVDSQGYSLSTRWFYQASLHIRLHEILDSKTVTVLHLCPQYGRIFNLDDLGHSPMSLTELQTLKLEDMENGQAVLTELLQRSPRLHTLVLEDVALASFQLSSTVHLSLKQLLLHEVVMPPSASGEHGGFHGIAEFTGLTQLTIEYCAECTDLLFLTELQNLEFFTFATDQRCVSNIRAITELPKLKSLSLMTSTVREEDLAEFFFPDQLTSIKADKLLSEKVWAGDLSNLTHLAFHSKMTDALLRSLTRREPAFYSIVPAWQRKGIRSTVYHRQTMGPETPHISLLVAVDLSNVGIAPNILELLSSISSLKELRLHMSAIIELQNPRSHVDDIGSLKFPALELLTFNSSDLFVRLLKKMDMPLVKHVGIWFDFKQASLAVDAVQSISYCREISFAVIGVPEDADFWRKLRIALEPMKRLKRIGWKQYESEPVQIPSDLVTSFAAEGVLIDDDATVFIQQQ